MAFEVSYHDRIDKLQGLDTNGTGPFDRLAWYALLAEDRNDVVIAEAASGDEAAAMVLARRAKGLESLTNWFSFTWRPVGTAPEALAALGRMLRRKTASIILAPLPEEDGTASLLERSFQKAGWLVFREHCDENHIVGVRGRSFAEYWAGRPGRLRTTLKRKRGKIDIEIFEDFDANAWSDYNFVYEKSWKPVEERADILERFANNEGHAGRLRLGIASADGTRVAAQFWTVDGGTAYIHKLAHTEAGAALSAGTVLTAAMFEHVIDRDKVEMIDFGTGSDAYKKDWMETVRARFRLECLDWRNPRAWPAIAKAVARRLARGTSQS
ncbi:GNAT family N-acetyltransferase [Qipengyuania sp. XHP0207]|uniref:GNAT family N-acetyltransferase n=1 Tax=Qipengyuania sp. XHP0207 TaxID=3038078 RepID=UPI00241D1224|nr:GNAT family N-acetyltransferase [Qipengyuania sp. XHP0207]MDG5747448.1 GNAT family N-acetyltransferase [Qipengyuania sp. XHP0207]